MKIFRQFLAAYPQTLTHTQTPNKQTTNRTLPVGRSSISGMSRDVIINYDGINNGILCLLLLLLLQIYFIRSNGCILYLIDTLGEGNILNNKLRDSIARVAFVESAWNNICGFFWLL